MTDVDVFDARLWPRLVADACEADYFRRMAALQESVERRSERVDCVAATLGVPRQALLNHIRRLLDEGAFAHIDEILAGMERYVGVRMKVKILIEFEVTTDLDADEHGELTENHAKSAASEAAYQYLCFTRNLGVTPSLEEVGVYVDGFGDCTVKIGEEHE